MRIPFNRPQIVGDELAYMEDAVSSGHTSASGPYSERAASILQDRLGVTDVLLTTSCTDALEMSGMLLDLGPGDTVIVPSFTFVTTALAFARTGATIRFADIEPVTLGIDPESVASLMDDSVRAVVAVHYAGVGCDLLGLRRVLADHPEVALIEDNAHGLFGTYDGQELGTFGRLGTLSFHETKNLICGEGGALLLNYEADRDRAWTLYHKGTNRRAFIDGRVDKYTWQDTGSSFGLSDLLAAYLLAQLERADEIMAARQRVYEAYDARLASRTDDLGLTTPALPSNRTSAYHMYYVLAPDRTTRDHLIKSLANDGIQAPFHYVPLHSAPAAATLGEPSSCPVTDDISGRLLRLPFFNTLTETEIDDVCASIERAVV